MKQKSCLFCDQIISGKKSNEHIFPQWLLDSFEIKTTQISPAHFSFNGDIVKSSRKHNLNNLLAGGICQQCNNGWMSTLKNSVKQNIIDLASDKKLIEDLDQKEKLLLAKWAFKTALVLNHGSNFLKNIPKKHYSHLHKYPNVLPQRVAVFAQQHWSTEKFYWIQGSQWHISSKDSSLNKNIESIIKSKSYKIALQFKNLLLLVAYNPIRNYLFSLWKGIHGSLYHPKGKTMWYKKNPDDFPWNDSIKALATFHISLGLSDPEIAINHK